MIENVNDFLSIAFLLLFLFGLIFYASSKINQKRVRKHIEEEYYYYKDDDLDDDN